MVGPVVSKGAGTEPEARTASSPAGPLPELYKMGVGWIDFVREAAWAVYHALPLPDRAGHLWRYTDPAEFLLPPGGAGRPHDGLLEIGIAPDDVRAGITAIPLSEAVKSDEGLLREVLGSLIPAEHGKPEALNAALWTAGAFVRVPRGVTAGSPIRLITSVADPGGNGAFHVVRNLVLVEEDASATIVEESRGPDLRDGIPSSGSVGLNEVTELFAGPGSKVRFVPLQHLAREVKSHRTFRARLDREARLETVIGSFGAGLYKADVGVHLDGQGAESKMVGVCFGDARQRADHHTVQDHRAAHTSSDIDFRVILAGRARSIYTGLIRIAGEAVHSEAYQENRNLLLSNQCKAESIPELEILTDEVRCKHGATMGPIDQDQLFYLATRGLAIPDATRMIASGFLETIFQNMPGDVAESIRSEILARLLKI